MKWICISIVFVCCWAVIMLLIFLIFENVFMLVYNLKKMWANVHIGLLYFYNLYVPSPNFVSGLHLKNWKFDDRRCESFQVVDWWLTLHAKKFCTVISKIWSNGSGKTKMMISCPVHVSRFFFFNVLYIDVGRLVVFCILSCCQIVFMLFMIYCLYVLRLNTF